MLNVKVQVAFPRNCSFCECQRVRKPQLCVFWCFTLIFPLSQMHRVVIVYLFSPTKLWVAREWLTLNGWMNDRVDLRTESCLMLSLIYIQGFEVQTSALSRGFQVKSNRFPLKLTETGSQQFAFMSWIVPVKIFLQVWCSTQVWKVPSSTRLIFCIHIEIKTSHTLKSLIVLGRKLWWVQV